MRLPTGKGVLLAAVLTLLAIVVAVAAAAFTRAPSAVPSMPRELQAAAGDARVLLTWQAVKAAHSYRVFADGARVGATQSTSFPVVKLANGRTYRFAVRAVNSDGVSPLTKPVAATPRALSMRSPARLSWFYKPPRSQSDQQVVVSEFDSFILTRGDEQFMSQVRRTRPGVRILQYFLLSQIIKPGAGEVEQRNNAAYLPGDFDRLWSQHPDWFLRDTNGDAIVEGGKYYRMDPGNDGWRSFWIERVKAANARWDGVFADNLDLSLIGFERKGIELARYPDDASYTDALAGFVGRIHQELSAATGKPFVPNLVHGSRNRDARNKYLDNIDGAMEEAWAVGWRSAYLSPDAWAAHLARVDLLQSRDKIVILVSQGDQSDDARQRFAYASYLLVAGPGVSFRYTHTGSYGQPWLYDTYDIPLGAPLGPRYRLADGTVRRDFAAGCVTVNASRRESVISQGDCAPPAAVAP